MARRTPGEGSITQRKDGRWQGALRLAGRRQTVYGKTRREVLGKLEALRGQAQTAGVLLERHTVGELCRAWHAAGTPRWAPTTTANYARYVQLIETGLGAQVPLGRLTPARLHALLLQHQRTPRTAQTLFYVLRAVLDLGVRWGWLAANPMERLPRPVVRTRPRTWWTPAQCQQFLAATRTHRWGPLWATALATGLRIGELLALRWEDIDPVLEDTRLSPAAKLVYAGIVRHIDYTKGTAYPGAERLCTLSGFGRTAVFQALAVLEQHGYLQRTRRGKTLSNVYYVPSTTRTSPEVKSTTRTSQPECSPSGERVKSARRTGEVRHADPNDNHLTRTTERDMQPLTPPELAGFDATLRDLPGYTPTPAFYAKVLKYEHLDLEEEAVKMAGWLRTKPRRQCSTAFVLNWLKRATTPAGTTNKETMKGATSPHAATTDRFAAFRKYG